MMVLAEHVKSFHGIVLSSRTFEQWKKVPPASKDVIPITLCDGITKFKIKESKA